MGRAVWKIVAVLACLVAANGIHAQSFVQQTLNSSTYGTDFSAGYAVASSGSVVAVGAPNCYYSTSQDDYGFGPGGQVFMYSCTTTLSCAGPASVTVTSSSVYGFGYSLALVSSGTILVVGVPYYEHKHDDGAVYVFYCAAYNTCGSSSAQYGPSGDNYYFGLSVAAYASPSTLYIIAGSKSGDNLCAYTCTLNAGEAPTCPSGSPSSACTALKIPGDSSTEMGRLVTANSNLFGVSDQTSSNGYVYVVQLGSCDSINGPSTCTPVATVSYSNKGNN